jgi:hypothetical protein
MRSAREEYYVLVVSPTQTTCAREKSHFVMESGSVLAYLV